MPQKVISIGSSMAVVLPKPLTDRLAIMLGQKVIVSAEGLDRLVIDRVRTENPVNPRTTDLIKWASAYVEKYRKDFEALADK